MKISKLSASTEPRYSLRVRRIDEGSGVDQGDNPPARITMQKNLGLIGRLKAWAQGKSSKMDPGNAGEQAAALSALRASFLDKIKGILDGSPDAVDGSLSTAVREFVTAATALVQSNADMQAAGKSASLAAILKSLQDAPDQTALVEAVAELDAWENVPREAAKGADVDNTQIKQQLDQQAKELADAKAVAEKQAKALEDARAQIKSLNDAKREDALDAKARRVTLPVALDGMKKLLRDLDDADAAGITKDAAKNADTLLAGLQAQWQKAGGIASQLTVVRGSSNQQGLGDDPEAVLEAEAEKLRAAAPADKPLTREAAIVEAAERNPAVYAQHVARKNAVRAG